MGLLLCCLQQKFKNNPVSCFLAHIIWLIDFFVFYFIQEIALKSAKHFQYLQHQTCNKYLASHQYFLTKMLHMYCKWGAGRQHTFQKYCRLRWPLQKFSSLFNAEPVYEGELNVILLLQVINHVFESTFITFCLKNTTRPAQIKTNLQNFEASQSANIFDTFF